MNALSTIQEHLKAWPQPRLADRDNVVIVPTQFLYPSMSLVKAHVECGAATAVVSDGGGAIHELAGMGEARFDLVKSFRSRAAPWDLSVSNDGWLQSRPVPFDRTAEMIAWVATASRDISVTLLARITTRSKTADFRYDLEIYLQGKYAENLKRKHVVVGASNKKHKFDFFVREDVDGRGLLLSAVLNDASSMNSAVVSHMDVSRTKQYGLRQRIIYDDNEDWQSADLTLLEAGAPPVAFSTIDRTLERVFAPL